MAEKVIIGGELEPQGMSGVVSDAKYILDRDQEKNQSEINEELAVEINNKANKDDVYTKEEIAGINSINKDVLPLDAVIPAPIEVSPETSKEPDVIFYSSYHRKIIATVYSSTTPALPSHYYVWPGYEKYVDTNNHNNPYDSKIYLCGGKSYIWDGTKLVAVGSGEQIQSDWNQTNTELPDFIKNKPTIEKLLGENYVFAGVADSSLDPSNAEGVFYLATEYGSYIHFLDEFEEPINVSKGLSVLFKGVGDAGWSREELYNEADFLRTIFTTVSENYQPKGNYQPAGNYATEQQLAGKVDKEVGKGLSTNDYTNEEKQKVADALVPADIVGKANKDEVYAKSETYNKTEIDSLITTPDQEYVTVTATAQTTAVTDLLPATGAADTIYRVGNWNGTQYDATCYSEYAWNGSTYIMLSTKSQVGEVYDISANHADTKYADLAAALGTNGANIPQSLQKGGMSVKFIQSSNNKYVQYRLMSDSFNTTPANWQGVDAVPTSESHNLVESGGVAKALNNIDKQINGGYDSYAIDYTTTSGQSILNQTVAFDYIVPSGTYNIDVLLNGTFAGATMTFYDEEDNRITGIKDKNNNSWNQIATGSILTNGNPFTFSKAIKKVQIYATRKITDGTIELTLSTEESYGIVEDINDLKSDVQGLESSKASKSQVDALELSVEDLDSIVNGNDNSKVLTVDFAANVRVDGAGSQYPTSFKLKPGTYKISAQKPSAFGEYGLIIYFFAAGGNQVNPVGGNGTVLNNGITISNSYVGPNASTQPFTFPSDVDHVKFYSPNGGKPSENCTFIFSADDVNKDQNIREQLNSIDVTPEIVMPKKLYLLSSNTDNIENSIYHKHYMSFQNPRFGIAINTGNNWRTSPRFIRTNAKGTIQAPTIKLYDIPNRKVLKTITPAIITGLKETNNGAKVINAIGDSFTHNGTWINEIDTLCTGLSFVGMRHPYAAGSGLRDEGRSGWTLAMYFESPKSPFMHVSGYTYYGSIDFWKSVVNDDSQSPLDYEGYDDYKSWFDTDGYKVNPPANALMYDAINDKYVYYNGSAWVDFSGTPTFEFDYAKYLSTWNITSPDFVMILLGTNDFAHGVSDESWTTWKNRMDTVITSIGAYASSVSKTIKIGLCTPTVRYGAENGSLGINQDIKSYNTFNGRKRIIETFETNAYEAVDVYVVDTGTAVDTEYGWMEYDTQINEKPFNYYEGSFREFYGYNDPHPSTAGYKQIGVVGAAFIQAKR